VQQRACRQAAATKGEKFNIKIKKRQPINNYDRDKGVCVRYFFFEELLMFEKTFARVFLEAAARTIVDPSASPAVEAGGGSAARASSALPWPPPQLLALFPLESLLGLLLLLLTPPPTGWVSQ
jgi:hypothetical protein